MTLGYNQLIAYVILDDETLKLKSDKRMFVDNNMNFPKPYRITKADTVTKSYMGIGIMTLIFSEDQYNSVTDNIELMICDYIPNKTITPLKIEYSGLPEVRNGGSVKMFTANTNKKVIWNINATNLQKKYIKIIETDNQIKIKCLYNELLVGTNFVLECVCNNVKTPLTITITGGV